MRENHLKSLVQDVEVRMRALNNLRQRMKEAEKATVRRRVYTVTGKEADEEAVEKLVETG